MNQEYIDSNIEKDAELEFENAKKKAELPSGIVNEKAWTKFLQINQSWKVRKDRYYKLKQGQSTISLDLAQKPSKLDLELQKYIIGVDEKNKIKKLNYEFWGIIQKAILFKKQAFGDDTVKLTEEGFIPDQESAITPIVIDLAGRYYTAEEIQKVVVEELGYSQVGIYTIRKIISANLVEINNNKEKFKQDYSDVRLGYKKSRLQELTELYNERKSIWNRDHKLTDEQELTSILEKIKKEIEGDMVLNGNLNIKVEDTANDYIQKELLKNVNIQAIIIARLAGQLNINPVLILSRLAHSRYAHFSGLGTSLSQTRMEDPISYASELTYNWQEIEMNNKKYVERNKQLGELPKPVNPNAVSDLKQKLLEKLKAARKPLDEAKKEQY